MCRELNGQDSLPGRFVPGRNEMHFLHYHREKQMISPATVTNQALLNPDIKLGTFHNIFRNGQTGVGARNFSGR